MPSDLILLPGEAAAQRRLKRAQSLVGTSPGRPPEDYYKTPPVATEALLRAETFSGLVWEPACGDGAICKVLEAHGIKTMATDLIDRGWGEAPHDFLTSDRTAPNIITNPPFKLAESFVRKALEQTTGKVAMLCKLQFLEGAKRKAMFESTPLKTVHVFSKRITMARNGKTEDYQSSMICFAWFVWEHRYTGSPTISWI